MSTPGEQAAPINYVAPVRVKAGARPSTMSAENLALGRGLTVAELFSWLALRVPNLVSEVEAAAGTNTGAAYEAERKARIEAEWVAGSFKKLGHV